MLSPRTAAGARAVRARLLLVVLVAALLPASRAPLWAASCPQSATFSSDSSGTTVDLGWTGVGHALELGALSFTIGLGSCSARSDGGCGTCPIAGLADADGTHRRCTSDTARSCRHDADCGGQGRCDLFLRSPIAVAAGGVGWCLLPSLTGHLSGSVEATDGSVALDLPLTLQSYEAALHAPCPLCVGDAVAADGKREGLCDGGAHAKEPCDGGGSALVKGGAPSLDCPPAAAASFGLLAESGRPLNLTTGTRSRALDAESPDTKANRAQGKALCDTCANDPARACASSADCAEKAPCGGLLGAPTAPNACDDGICTSSDGIHGTCAGGPFDRACASDPGRSCLTDEDCPAPEDHCRTSLRRCFPGGGKPGDAVIVRGTAERPRAGKMQSTLAALFCVPPGRNATTNQLFGLPGLGRVLMPGTWTLRTQSVEVLP